MGIRCYSPPMPFGIGIWELLILLLVLLLVFGPKRLPEMGRQLGKGMREFKDSVTGDSKDDEVSLPPAEPAVPAAPAASESRERDSVS
jgi:sec-independent protein translocase protein TatA